LRDLLGAVRGNDIAPLAGQTLTRCTVARQTAKKKETKRGAGSGARARTAAPSGTRKRAAPDPTSDRADAPPGEGVIPALADVDDDDIIGLTEADEEAAERPASARVGGEFDPALAGGDPDAAATATGSGEEAVGGSTPTPDQNDVDDIGRALGVTYHPDEPLHTTEKIGRRDDERWELNPASSEDFEERQRVQQQTPKAGPRRRG
jgi:hypothetical protein